MASPTKSNAKASKAMRETRISNYSRPGEGVIKRIPLGKLSLSHHRQNQQRTDATVSGSKTSKDSKQPKTESQVDYINSYTRESGHISSKQYGLQYSRPQLPPKSPLRGLTGHKPIQKGLPSKCTASTGNERVRTLRLSQKPNAGRVRVPDNCNKPVVTRTVVSSSITPKKIQSFQTMAPRPLSAPKGNRVEQFARARQSRTMFPVVNPDSQVNQSSASIDRFPVLTPDPSLGDPFSSAKSSPPKQPVISVRVSGTLAENYIPFPVAISGAPHSVQTDRSIGHTGQTSEKSKKMKESVIELRKTSLGYSNDRPEIYKYTNPSTKSDDNRQLVRQSDLLRSPGLQRGKSYQLIRGKLLNARLLVDDKGTEHFLSSPKAVFTPNRRDDKLEAYDLENDHVLQDMARRVKYGDNMEFQYLHDECLRGKVIRNDKANSILMLRLSSHTTNGRVNIAYKWLRFSKLDTDHVTNETPHRSSMETPRTSKYGKYGYKVRVSSKADGLVLGLASNPDKSAVDSSFGCGREARSDDRYHWQRPTTASLAKVVTKTKILLKRLPVSFKWRKVLVAERGRRVLRVIAGHVKKNLNKSSTKLVSTVHSAARSPFPTSAHDSEGPLSCTHGTRASFYLRRNYRTTLDLNNAQSNTTSSNPRIKLKLSCGSSSHETLNLPITEGQRKRFAITGWPDVPNFDHTLLSRSATSGSDNTSNLVEDSSGDPEPPVTNTIDLVATSRTYPGPIASNTSDIVAINIPDVGETIIEVPLPITTSRIPLKLAGPLPRPSRIPVPIMSSQDSSSSSADQPGDAYTVRHHMKNRLVASTVKKEDNATSARISNLATSVEELARSCSKKGAHGSSSTSLEHEGFDGETNGIAIKGRPAELIKQFRAAGAVDLPLSGGVLSTNTGGYGPPRIIPNFSRPLSEAVKAQNKALLGQGTPPPARAPNVTERIKKFRVISSKLFAEEVPLDEMMADPPHPVDAMLRLMKDNNNILESIALDKELLQVNPDLSHKASNAMMTMRVQYIEAQEKRITSIEAENRVEQEILESMNASDELTNQIFLLLDKEKFENEDKTEGVRENDVRDQAEGSGWPFRSN